MPISTVMQLTDRMSGQLRAIHQANAELLSDYRALSGSVIRVDASSAVQNLHELTGSLLDTNMASEDLISSLRIAEQAQDSLSEQMRESTDQTKKTRQEQEKYHESLGKGKNYVGSYVDSLKKMSGALAGLFSVAAAKNFVTDSMAAYDIQNNSERQLKTVLYNVGASPDAFNNLASMASNIQGRTIYGDEAMLGGAAEFATYISDENAIQSMMGTLANYAAGMSGGGEVGKQQMVEYATQLGKALDGTYDGLLKKGFTLSDVQKEIIETGTDMQKALVLDEVISQSWAGLAEQMANTPEGKIIQFKNSLGDLTEMVGGRVYPAVLRLFDTANTNMPRMESMMMGFADGASMVIYAASEIVGAAGTSYQFFADHWSAIGPIVYGASGAFVAYNSVLLLHKGYLAGVAVWEGILATRQSILAVRTGTATAAQAGFNIALLASPVTWFAGGVLLGVTALYSFIGMLNDATGTTYSATGMIAGLFGTMGTAIIRVFMTVGDVALGVLQGIAEAVDFVLRSDYAGTISGWRDSLKEFATEKFSLGDAFGKGYSWGVELEGKIRDFTPQQLFRDLSGFRFENGLSNMVLPVTSEELGDIADDTSSIKRSLEVSEEELKWIRDIAERDSINRFTTAEIKIEMQNVNQINSEQDIDGIIDSLTDRLYEEMTIAAEGGGH